MNRGYRSYRRRKKRASRGMLIVLLLLVTVFMVSCVAGADPLWLRDVFGVSIGDYEEEATVQVHAPNGEKSRELADMVQSLTTANSLSLPAFDSPSEAVSLYRDALLNDLLREHYLLYTGNNSVLSTLSAAYAGRNITTLIPEEDLEGAAARYFGAGSVRHKSGTAFEYLDRANGYTAPLQAWVSGAEVQTVSLEETENTYRLQFYLTDGGETSGLYRAIFAKRDGGYFLYSLSV